MGGGGDAVGVGGGDAVGVGGGGGRGSTEMLEIQSTP